MTRISLFVVLVLLEIGNISAFLTKLTGYAWSASSTTYCISTVTANYIQSGLCSPITMSTGSYNAILSCSSQSSNSAWSLNFYYSYDANCGFTPIDSGTASGVGCFYSVTLAYYPTFFSVDCGAASIAPTKSPSFKPSVAPSFTITTAPSLSIAPTRTYAPSAVFMTRYIFYGDSTCSAANIYADDTVNNQQCFSAFLNQNGTFTYYYGKVSCAANSLSSSWTVTFFNDSNCAIPSGQSISGYGTTCQLGTLSSHSTNLQVLCSYVNTSAPTISPTLSPSATVATIIAANTTSFTCSNPLTASTFSLNRCSQVTLATETYLLNVTCQTSGAWSMNIYGVSTFGCVSSAFLGQYSGTSGTCSRWPYNIFGYGEASYAIYCFQQRSVAPSQAPTAHPTTSPSMIPSQSPTVTSMPTVISSFMPSMSFVPISTLAPSTLQTTTGTPVPIPTHAPTRRPTTNTQKSLVSLYSSASSCSDQSSLLASIVMSPSSTSCTSTASIEALSSYATNYQSAALQCDTNTSTSAWTLSFYSGSSCSGQLADSYSSSSGGCQCTSSVNNQVSANPLRILVDCGAGKAASTRTTAFITAGCSSLSTTSSSGSNTGYTFLAAVFSSIFITCTLCIGGIYAFHIMHDTPVGVANFSDHNSSLSGALPQASAPPIQAMIYDPEEGGVELPHVTRIEVVDSSILPADVVFVEPQFVHLQTFGRSQSVDLEQGGEIKQDELNQTGHTPEELSPKRRYRKNQRAVGQNRANIQAWQDNAPAGQQSPPPPRQQRSSRSLLQASTTRLSASHNSLRAISMSADENEGSRRVGRVHPVNGNSSNDEGDDD